MGGFIDCGLELIRRTSSDLSPDVEAALETARDAEAPGSTARSVLESILANNDLSRHGGTPICQDTGFVSFFLHIPRGMDPEPIKADLSEALRQATREGLLRPNAVHPLTGKNTGDNSGAGHPSFTVTVHDEPTVIVDLLLKGGGSENCGAQYKLPDPSLKAGRDLAGAEKCVIDAAFKAQGFGCAPGILGVCLGGDRAGGYAEAKKQLLRPLGDTNPEPQLAGLEARLKDRINTLGIGPMGFGGGTTVLAVKAGVLHRHPACYFVTIAYSCWASRRRRMVVRDGVAEQL